MRVDYAHKNLLPWFRGKHCDLNSANWVFKVFIIAITFSNVFMGHLQDFIDLMSSPDISEGP